MKERDGWGPSALSEFRSLRLTESREVVRRRTKHRGVMYTSRTFSNRRMHVHPHFGDFFRGEQHAMLKELKTKTR